MIVHIFSTAKGIEKNFDAVRKSKKYDILVSPPSGIKTILKKAPIGSMVYLDISSLAKTEAAQALKLLAKQDSCRYGIIDPRGSAVDVAELFHNGASDYIGATLLKKGVQPKRLEAIAKFKAMESTDETQPAVKKKYTPSGKDWKGIIQGKEYTFCFMFVELDNKNELKGGGPEQFGRISSSFRSYLENIVTPFSGKIWMWMDFGGLILFPFDGKKCDAIEAAFRLMINRMLMSAELIHLDINLSYRIAMHIGNTVYKAKGNTGTIISDSINSVFHLGQKYAEPGGFYLTDEIFRFAPGGLMNHFVPAGKFEGRNIFRMKRLT
ncbi:MAG: hypothetical protein E4G96_05110 [Chrysiogenales bacterium]|nr:MAG: hypothetical protein E4G96_05110 [Chrysiogenales bacterium]